MGGMDQYHTSWFFKYAFTFPSIGWLVFNFSVKSNNQRFKLEYEQMIAWLTYIVHRGYNHRPDTIPAIHGTLKITVNGSALNIQSMPHILKIWVGERSNKEHFLSFLRC